MAITSNTDKGNVYEEVSLELEGDYFRYRIQFKILLRRIKKH